MPLERRTSVPARPERPLEILKFLKNTIGQELTRMSFPLGYNEALSVTQRTLEFLEFNFILDKAAEPGISENLQQAYVCLFIAANFLRLSDRIKKPFNPLLGETYELDRWEEPEGYRFIVEQVEHHPPVTAIFGESKKGWTYQSNITVNSSFKLLSMAIDITPNGMINIFFKNTGKTYIVDRPLMNFSLLSSWMFVTGQNNVWVTGDVDFFTTRNVLRMNDLSENEENQENEENLLDDQDTDNIEKIKLTQLSTVYHGSRAANLMNSDKNGNSNSTTNSWFKKKDENEHIKVYANINNQEFTVKSESVSEGGTLYDKNNQIIYEYSRSNLPGQLDKAEKNDHCWANFQIELNQMEENICPTDARFRPDQRLMEMGDYDNAELIKPILEQQQRNRRKVNCQVQPKWFKKVVEKSSTIPCWVLNKNYFYCKNKIGWAAEDEERAQKLYDFSGSELAESSESRSSNSAKKASKSKISLRKKSSNMSVSLSSEKHQEIQASINLYNLKI